MRDTKRIYSLGRAQEEGADRADGEADSAPQGQADRGARSSVADGDADAGTAELIRVIDVGEPAAPAPSATDGDDQESAARQRSDPAALKPRPVSLPRQEKPVPLTRELHSSPHRSTGPLGTIRVSPVERAAASPPHDDQASPASSTQRPRKARRCRTCGTQFSAPEVRFCPFDGNPLEEVPDWDPSSDPLIGQTVLQRFIVESVLAEGSMGTVYRVRHLRLDARFAMKVLRRDLARETEVASRLIDEARATAAIGHPNIVAVSDFGEITAAELPDLGKLTLPFFVMELLEGSSLAEVIREQGPLQPERVARIMTQCASALAAAHGAGIIHRDLKPANIRLSRSELGEEMVKVVDFGVSKIMGLSRKTQPGVVFGTPHYMSPEQGKGLEIDHQTDVYALGVIMYECVTGRVPFEADTYMGVVTKHLFTHPEPIEYPPADPCGCALKLIITCCLAKKRADRYQTMSAVAGDLDRAIRGEQPAAAPEAHAARLELREEERLPSSRPGEPTSLSRRAMRPVSPALMIAVIAIAAVAAITIALSVSGLLSAGSAAVSESLPVERDDAATAAQTTPPAQPAQPSVTPEPAEDTATAPARQAPARSPEPERTAQPRASVERSTSRPAAKPTVAATPTTSRAPAAPTPSPKTPKPAQPAGDIVDPWSK